MAISAKDVQALREKTGAGVMDCKRALEQADGSLEGAVRILREKGIASAEKRSGRAASEGVVGSYVHLGSKIGVLVELNCETDFVARNEEFQGLARELAMQVAFSNPSWLRPEEIPEEILEREREIAAALARNEPEAPVPETVEENLRKFREENSLLTQPYIRDNKRRVEDIVQDLRARLGENIVVRRFARFQVGEEV